MVHLRRAPLHGVIAAFLTPMFLGMAPIFGKISIQAGAEPFTVAALRTLVAVLILWVTYALFFRRFIFIYPAGLLGCVVIGIINGIGSLFYYGGLSLVDASVAQLLNGMYLVFAVLMVRIGGERLDLRMMVRILLALLALIILTGYSSEPINWLGVGLMLGNALMFAGTFILSQYVLYEMPSPTVALYVLSTMGIVVIMAWLATGAQPLDAGLQTALPAIFILGITTALSRLAMFAGVKFLGSMQTAVLAMTEIAVALTLSFAVLHERLTPEQWVGVGLLALSILLVRARDLAPASFNPGKLFMLNLATQQFQWIAFHRAFGRDNIDGEEDVMSKLSTSELRAIREMMGVEDRPTDPFPIKSSGQYSVDLSAFLPQEGQDSAPGTKRGSSKP